MKVSRVFACFMPDGREFHDLATKNSMPSVSTCTVCAHGVEEEKGA